MIDKAQRLVLICDNDMKRYCPCCKKMVAEVHFSCISGAAGGKAFGKSKIRGDSEYYRKIARKRCCNDSQDSKVEAE